MIKYIAYRILAIIPMLFLASFIIFYLLRLNNTDPVSLYIINANLTSTPQVIQEVSKEFGLDKPILTQYILWLKKAIQFDFGKSYMTNREVISDFLYYLPNTIILTIFSFLLTLLISIPLGIISTYYKDKIPDFIIRFFCFIGVCIPNFWLAFLLIMLFSLTLNWLPSLGVQDYKSFILPSISIALMSICINIRLIRANMLEVSKERHIIYASMRGLSKTKITIKHIFYNAMLPVVTSFGMYIGELIGGALIIESIFAIPGIGYYSIQGIANHDYPIIQCFVIIMCLVFSLCNLIVDILYAFLDPRIRKNIEYTHAL